MRKKWNPLYFYLMVITGATSIPSTKHEHFFKTLVNIFMFCHLYSRSFNEYGYLFIIH
jgi:hypothetical protein